MCRDAIHLAQIIEVVVIDSLNAVNNYFVDTTLLFQNIFPILLVHQLLLHHP